MTIWLWCTSMWGWVDTLSSVINIISNDHILLRVRTKSVSSAECKYLQALHCAGGWMIVLQPRRLCLGSSTCHSAPHGGKKAPDSWAWLLWMELLVAPCIVSLSVVAIRRLRSVFHTTALCRMNSTSYLLIAEILQKCAKVMDIIPVLHNIDNRDFSLINCVVWE